MRPENIERVERNLKKEEVFNKKVIEIGAYNVNGTIRPTIEKYSPESYLGTDIEEGPGVDMVVWGENLVETFSKDSFDLVVTCDALEHVYNLKEVISNIKGVLKPGGYLYLTLPSTAFPFHAYPNDYWRFEKEDLEFIFSDLSIESLEVFTDSPGVFMKARKKVNFSETDISNYKLYSILTRTKITQEELHSLSEEIIGILADLNRKIGEKDYFVNLINQKNEEINSLNEIIKKKQSLINKYKNSKSWKYTGYLRRLKKVLSK